MVKDDRGVTIIELLVVIAIMAVLVTLVTPKLQGTVQSFKFKGFVRQAVADLRSAQQQAISTGKPYRVYFTPNAYEIRRVDNPSPLQETVDVQRTANTDVQLANISFTDPSNPGLKVNYAEFEADGTTVSVDGSLTISLQSDPANYFDNIQVKAFTGKISVTP